MAKRPATQWYWGDWLKDPNLGQCSPATRGIWMDLLAAMHESDQTGKITGTAVSLARICRCSPEEMVTALRELDATKTADVTFRHADVTEMSRREVTIINRRMHREWQERCAATQRQRRKRVMKKSEGKNGVATDKQTAEPSRRCHADVTQKSRLHSSSSSSTSVKEHTQRESEINIPEHIREQARQVLGLTCEATLLYWLRECEYPPGWISQALAATEAKHPAQPKSYASGILRSYMRNGGPPNGKCRSSDAIAVGTGRAEVGAAAGGSGKFAGWD